jgi:hypothetical protein
MGSRWLAIAALAIGCEMAPVDRGCWCEGDVPGGRLDVACGQTQCLGDTEYECTGVNTAIAVGACGTSGGDAGPGDDAGMIEDDAGMIEDDAGMIDMDDAGMTCTERTFYADTDRDGFGDTSATMRACDMPSGYVADDTDCDDDDAAIHPNADEACNTADDDCDGTTAMCAGANGTYTGTYRIVTTERLGSSVINSMTCTGTATITVALDGTPVLDGDATCTYTGGLTLFSRTQTATLEGTLLPDGTLEGRARHRFDGSTDRTITLTGTWADGTLTIEGTGSWRPHPMSVQPWEIELDASGAR